MRNRQSASFFSFALLILVLMAYAPSFKVPFYADDFWHFVQAPEVHAFSIPDMWTLDSSRIIASLSFAANFAIHGNSVFGYHLFNLFIHLINTLLVFRLSRRILKNDGAAIFAAATFALHPIQTQAVTYICQRMASMAALFMLAALEMFSLAEERKQRKWLAFALVAGLLAAFTKETAAMLPAAVLLFWWYGLDGGKSKFPPNQVLLWVVIPIIMIIVQVLHPGTALTLARKSYYRPEVYFATEMPIIWGYVGKLLFPVGLHFWYDVQPLNGLSDPLSLLSATLHIALIWIATRFGKTHPPIGFGVLWFYSMLYVESSFFNNFDDFAFEHRLYLPMVGPAIVLSYGLVVLNARISKQQQTKVAMVAIIVAVVLAGLTYKRNALWTDQYAFWEANLEETPNGRDALGDAAIGLVSRNRCNEALELVDKSSMRWRRNNTILLIGAKAATCLERYDLALRYLESAPMTGENMYIRGLIALNTNQTDTAIDWLEKALKEHFDFDMAWANLIYANLQIGRFENGVKLAEDFLKIHNVPLSGPAGKKAMKAFLLLGEYKKERREEIRAFIHRRIIEVN